MWRTQVVISLAPPLAPRIPKSANHYHSRTARDGAVATYNHVWSGAVTTPISEKNEREDGRLSARRFGGC